MSPGTLSKEASSNVLYSPTAPRANPPRAAFIKAEVPWLFTLSDTVLQSAADPQAKAELRQTLANLNKELDFKSLASRVERWRLEDEILQRSPLWPEEYREQIETLAAEAQSVSSERVKGSSAFREPTLGAGLRLLKELKKTDAIAAAAVEASLSVIRGDHTVDQLSFVVAAATGSETETNQQIIATRCYDNEARRLNEILDSDANFIEA